MLPKDGQHRGARVGAWAGKIYEVCPGDQPVLVCLALSHLSTESPECQRPFSSGHTRTVGFYHEEDRLCVIS